MDPNHPPIIPSRRKLKVGATCKVIGEGNDRFTIMQVFPDGIVVDDGSFEANRKIYSVRYPPRRPRITR